MTYQIIEPGIYSYKAARTGETKYFGKCYYNKKWYSSKIGTLEAAREWRREFEDTHPKLERKSYAGWKRTKTAPSLRKELEVLNSERCVTTFFFIPFDEEGDAKEMIKVCMDELPVMIDKTTLSEVRRLIYDEIKRLKCNERRIVSEWPKKPDQNILLVTSNRPELIPKLIIELGVESAL